MTEIVAWHASAAPQLEVRPGLHVGTYGQAIMRGGRHIHRVVLLAEGRMPRLRDRGSWSVRRLRDTSRRAGVAVYLNRHEGIPTEEFERARASVDLDAIPDRIFRRHVPSCADSWIILDPMTVRSIGLVSSLHP